ncbi:hypothetical protein C8R46DRAFT_1211233 [Mycena filopes]|nr:hypothetical protein C8R46DRAFT_1211233 [Mycena filopes]
MARIATCRAQFTGAVAPPYPPQQQHQQQYQQHQHPPQQQVPGASWATDVPMQEPSGSNISRSYNDASARMQVRVADKRGTFLDEVDARRAVAQGASPETPLVPTRILADDPFGPISPVKPEDFTVLREAMALKGPFPAWDDRVVGRYLEGYTLALRHKTLQLEEARVKLEEARLDEEKRQFDQTMRVRVEEHYLQRLQLNLEYAKAKAKGILDEMPDLPL